MCSAIAFSFGWILKCIETDTKSSGGKTSFHIKSFYSKKSDTLREISFAIKVRAKILKKNKTLRTASDSSYQPASRHTQSLLSIKFLINLWVSRFNSIFFCFVLKFFFESENSRIKICNLKLVGLNDWVYCSSKMLRHCLYFTYIAHSFNTVN